MFNRFNVAGVGTFNYPKTLASTRMALSKKRKYILKEGEKGNGSKKEMPGLPLKKNQLEFDQTHTTTNPTKDQIKISPKYKQKHNYKQKHTTSSTHPHK